MLVSSLAGRSGKEWVSMANCAACGAALPEGARFCPACAAPVELAVTEERKLVTILFADLVGSTAHASDEDPERVRALLDRFYGALAEEAEAAGGTVEKFAGDAVLAAFGARGAQEDHAERALHAALSMQRRVLERFGDRISVRIGVGTGEVAVGPAYVGGSFVAGDAVNVAKRIEEAAEPGGVLVGERTVASVRGAFEFDEPLIVEAKGKPAGVPCRPLLRALSLQRPRGVSGLGSAFLGRESELELLRSSYRRAAERGETHVVTIVGDAGVGKTRLVRELWGWLAGQSPEPLRRTGRCLPYGQATYWPLGEVLKEQLGILENDPAELVRERLGEREILGLALGLDVAGELHPLAARDRLFQAWSEFLRELVAERPLVVLVEDLHWAEDPLLDLIERLIREVRGRLLVIGTARPELLDRRPSWGGGLRNSSLLGLEPLSPEDARLLVDELVASTLPDELRGLVVERAEGNPFFIEELLGTLIDRGVLRPGVDGWQAGEIDLVEIPDSVQALVAARIDLLPAIEKRALQAAAVTGRIFWAGPVLELLAGDQPDLLLLEKRDFVYSRSGSSMAGEREYSFKHALTRDVAYGSVPKAQRARLHAAFAEWLARLGKDEEHASLLAHHYAQAVHPEYADLAWSDEPAELERLRTEARRWLRRAAALATSRYELDEALELLERALTLASDRHERAEIWRATGRAYGLLHAGQEFWNAMQHAIGEAEDSSYRSELYADLAFETALRSGIWPRMPERETVLEWVERALEGAPAGSRARAKALVAKARWLPTEGSAAAVEASELAEQLGEPELRSAAWDVRGIVSFVAGDYQGGRVWAERRLGLLDEISDPDVRAEILSAPITAYVWSGRFSEARRLAREHADVTSRLTPHHRVHGVAIEMEVEELLGRWDLIHGLQERAGAAVEANLRTPCVRNARALLVCALASECLGDATGARALEERALELWMEGYGFTLDTPRLRLALARGDLAAAERLLASPDQAPGWHRGWFVFANTAARLDALAALGHGRQLELEAPAHLSEHTYLEPFALRALGQARRDEHLIEQALERFRALGLDWYADQTQRLLAGHHQA
jgi:class 3 adenylate cyclase